MGISIQGKKLLILLFDDSQLIIAEDKDTISLYAQKIE